MKYEIAVDQDRQLICTKAWGELTVASVTELTKAVGAAATEHGIETLLFDMRETTEDTDTMDAFLLATHPEDRGMKRSHKRAIVYSSGDELYEFFETVSNNRGYPVKIFTDMDLALAWLRED